MTYPVILSIRGQQHYMDQEPERIELVTEGSMEKTPEGWEITYQESALTGLEGVTTTFQVIPQQITLKRVGKLNSEMVFRKGEIHNSLYQMEFGALMLTVCAKEVFSSIGTGYLEEQIGLLDGDIKSFFSLVEKERESLPRDIS